MKRSLQRKKLLDLAIICMVLTVFTGVPIGSKFVSSYTGDPAQSFPHDLEEYVSLGSIMLSWIFLVSGGIGLTYTYYNHGNEEFNLLIGMNACIIIGCLCLIIAESSAAIHQIGQGWLLITTNVLSVCLITYVTIQLIIFATEVIALIDESRQNALNVHVKNEPNVDSATTSPSQKQSKAEVDPTCVVAIHDSQRSQI